nr:hypothetical protein [uncultured Dysosmobacter sp.]
MPESIEARRARRKREAVRGVVLFGLLQLACAVCFASLCFIPGLPGWAVVLFAVLALLCAAPLAFSLVTLKQRFREIEGGELDAAAEY